jgi:hypothetical protein
MRNHPALEKLYKDNRGQPVANVEEYEKFLNFVVIDRYVSVNQQQLRGGLGGVERLAFLQNTKPIDSYTKAVNDLADKLVPLIESPNEKTKKFAEALSRYRSELRRIAGSTDELYVLAEALNSLLEDRGDEAGKRPGLADLWAMAENAQLKEAFEKLRDEVMYGDPLYVAKSFGKGRVVVFLTSAGASWNDLDGFGKAYYPPMMINMQGYLASAGTDANLVLGGGFEFNLDRNAYDSKVRKWFYSEDAKNNKATFKPIGEDVMPDKGGSYNLVAQDGKTEPGIYVYRFAEKRAEPGKGAVEGSFRPDFRVLPYNVDALAEGNLARANSDDITQIAAKAPLHTASDSDDSLKTALLAKKRDLSENPWIYFVMLLVLIFEQAMAVRLSFHTAEASAPAPVGMGKPALATA